jgi:hypothetical protein
MTHFPVDPDSGIQQESFAVIQNPRKNRKRFPEGCVTTVADKEEALSRSEGVDKSGAALVYGPSVSSEGFRIYYLVRWL